MSDTNQREATESLLERTQRREEEINRALKLEAERHAAAVRRAARLGGSGGESKTEDRPTNGARGATWREPVLSQREESDVYSRKRDGLFGNVIQSSARR
jgi:hypothetical protein